MSKSSQNLMAGAGVLAAAGLVAKVLSAIYRVPFQNLVGNTGFYVYQQVYPIYGIGMVLALSGWPLFISKIITEQPDDAHQQLVARRLFWSLVGISAVLFTIVFGGAPALALAMGGNIRLTPVIRAVAWMFWYMPFLAVGRGFAQGQRNMIPTATSQVVEQIVRVAIIIGVAWWGVHTGWSDYRIGEWATFGATIAGLAATLFLVRTLRSVWQQPITLTVKQDKTITWRQLFKRLWFEGRLLALLAALLVLLQLVDSFSTKALLETFGLSAAKAEYTKGVYDRGQPLVQLGMVLATGLSTSLLPALRQHFVRQDNVALRHDFQLTMRLAIILSGVSAIGLVAVMPAVNQLLFGSREGSVALSWFVLAIVPATLMTIATSALQSFDRTRGLIWLVWVTMTVKAGLNVWLIPHWGITGASIATTVALLPILGYALLRLPRTLWQGWLPQKWWLKLLGTLVVTGAFAKMATMVSDSLFGVSRGASVLTAVVAVIVGAVAFVVMVATTDLLTTEEWEALPKGDRLYAILKRGKE
ncbi:polysaccharide biosynthesis protein [Weissella cibaria]|nr:polysaccharide biosynthesis protein [Weissella cibaria]